MLLDIFIKVELTQLRCKFALFRSSFVEHNQNHNNNRGYIYIVFYYLYLYEIIVNLIKIVCVHLHGQFVPSNLPSGLMS